MLKIGVELSADPLPDAPALSISVAYAIVHMHNILAWNNSYLKYIGQGRSEIIFSVVTCIVCTGHLCITATSLIAFVTV